MTFIDNFKSFFTSEERDSELYRIMSIIGANAEKTILEEINAEMRRMMEISLFPDHKLRSWLAFFLMPVRNMVSARGVGRLVVNSINDSSETSFVIPSHSVIRGRNGRNYELQNDLTLSVGDEVPFSFIQGKSVTVKVNYSEFISIPISAGNIDISDMKVFTSSGVEIPIVKPFRSCPYDLQQEFPKLAEQLIGYADTGYKDFSLGNQLTRHLSSLWESVVSVSVRPHSGFFPFCFNNMLYIKIFPGGVPGDDLHIPRPDGQEMTVHYRVSDGMLGNLFEDQLEAFEVPPTLSDGGTVSYSLYNSPALNGVNPPSHAELVNLLRKRFFASTHVSSIPEYTAWFLSQPSVGDCLVISDYVRWRQRGDLLFSGHDITGTVEVYLLDNAGNIVHKDNPIIGLLDTELSKDRDIAFLDYKTPLVFWHYFMVQFRSVLDEGAFLEHANAAIRTLYSISWVRAMNSSLFKDLDMDVVLNAVRGNHSPAGLKIIPYHYCEFPFNLHTPVSNPLVIPLYSGGRPGGFYEFWEVDDVDNPTKFGHFRRYDSDDCIEVVDADGNIEKEREFIEGEPFAVFREFVEVDGFSTNIYRYQKRKKTSDGVSFGWDWGNLFGTSEASLVGRRTINFVEFDVNKLSYLRPGVFRCFWLLENEGIISVGCFTDEFGIRKLPTKTSDILNKSVTETYFGGVVHFEKYF